MANSVFGSTTEAINDVKDKISGGVGAAVSAIDAKRAPLAGGLESAAAGLHTGAGSLEDTASYLRNNKLNDMWGDVQGMIKRYPGVALIGAVVIGFAAGRLIRRS